MRVSLLDFELNKDYEAADCCDECGGKIVFRITYRSPDHPNMGAVWWRCLRCEREDVDIVGWEQADKTVEFMGQKFYPLTARANIGPCLLCGKLVIGVPLILFLDKGEKGELDFCFTCVKKNGWDEKLLGARLL